MKTQIPAAQKTFAVFAGDRHKSQGGWNDYQGKFKAHFLSIPLLEDHIDQIDQGIMDHESQMGWIQVVNLDESNLEFEGLRREGKWCWKKLAI